MDTVLTAVATPLMWTIGIVELAVIFFILAILAAPVVIILWLLTRRTGSRDTAAAAQDEQILREMNEGLQRMEERIEALETLLAEEKSKGGQK
ncbi:MAG: envelope stress response membrane protein PspB [Candidatus Hydrogenedentes bacterium]|nr:envelope stress response membrane protein PspB [Candidatus Hydrogenedentota bacterium]